MYKVYFAFCTTFFNSLKLLRVVIIFKINFFYLNICSYDSDVNDWYNGYYGKILPGGDVMDFSNFFQNLSTLKIVTSILDLLIVWYVLYLLITVFKGTKAIQLLKGILVIVIGQQISMILNLTATSKLFDIVIQWGY